MHRRSSTAILADAGVSRALADQLRRRQPPVQMREHQAKHARHGTRRTRETLPAGTWRHVDLLPLPPEPPRPPRRPRPPRHEAFVPGGARRRKAACSE